MALCKKVVGHPKFFEILKGLANSVPNEEVDKLMIASRVVNNCKAALKEAAGGKRVTWIDPTEVETKEDWQALRDMAKRSGQPFDDDTVWNPDATATMTLSADEFEFIHASMKKNQGKLSNASTMLKLAVIVMLDNAVQVEMKA